MFCTGVETLPPLGLSEPGVITVLQNSSVLPNALRIPRLAYATVHVHFFTIKKSVNFKMGLLNKLGRESLIKFFFVHTTLQ